MPGTVKCLLNLDSADIIAILFSVNKSLLETHLQPLSKKQHAKTSTSQDKQLHVIAPPIEILRPKLAAHLRTVYGTGFMRITLSNDFFFVSPIYIYIYIRSACFSVTDVEALVNILTQSL